MASDVGEQKLEIILIGDVELGSREGLEFLLKLIEGGDLGIDAGTSVVLKLGVVLVKASEGAVGGRVFEIGLIEILFGECGEGLGRAFCRGLGRGYWDHRCHYASKNNKNRDDARFCHSKSYNSHICNRNGILLRRYFFQLEFVEQ